MGWRWAAFLSGCVFLLVCVPVSFQVRRSPESMGLLPDGDVQLDENFHLLTPDRRKRKMAPIRNPVDSTASPGHENDGLLGASDLHDVSSSGL